MHRPHALLALAASTLAVGLTACGGASDESGASAADSSSGSGDTSSLSLVAYSTPKVVYDEVIPAFRKSAEGKGVGFATSFGASGDQSRAVDAGQKADVVTFSTEPDMTRLVDSGLVDAKWNAGSNKGLINTSVVSLIVRKGNPKGIKGWDDLLKPGVDVLTPNPFTSGAAKWNLIGAYGQAALQDDGSIDDAKGLAYVSKLIKDHVKVQDKSGREALQTFLSGRGDVLISYENEALTAQKQGEDVEYVNPDKSAQINIDIAATKAAKEPQADNFLKYALSKPAQDIFASWGYRPVNQESLQANAAKFPKPAQLFTIEQVGGWTKLNKDLFDAKDGDVAKIEEQAGVSTGD